MANINKIRLSGQTYDIQDPNASKTVELTQAQYDALTVKDPNTFYIITDAQGADLSQYYTSAQTESAITQAVSGKVDTSTFNTYSGSVDTALASKADTATTYTKTEVDNAITAATSTKQDTLVSGTNIKTINNESLLGSGNITIQGGGSGSSYTAGDGIDITNDVISVTGMVDTTTFNTYSGSVETALSGKQDTLSAGTNITIVDNVISAEGGGSITIDPSLDSGSTNAVANSAITNAIDAKASKSQAIKWYSFGEINSKAYVKFQKVDGSYLSNIYYSKINGRIIWGITTTTGTKNFELVETSAITTSVTSSSTDAQVPSAKAVNDKLGGLNLVKLTQTEYDALTTKDDNTVYFIGDSTNGYTMKIGSANVN